MCVSLQAACLRSCNANPACNSWNFNKTRGTCGLQGNAPNVHYARGNDCGLRGGWGYDKLFTEIPTSNLGRIMDKSPTKQNLKKC